MKSQRACTAASLLLGVSLFATTLAGSAFAQSTSSSAAASGPASPWDQRVNAAAVQADAWFQNYRCADRPVQYNDLDKRFQQSTFRAHFVEVGVDAATGETRVRRMLAVCAAGRILNPKTAAAR